MLVPSKDMLRPRNADELVDGFCGKHGQKFLVKAQRDNPYANTTPVVRIAPPPQEPSITNALFQALFTLSASNRQQLRELASIATERHANEPLGRITASELARIGQLVQSPLARVALAKVAAMTRTGEISRLLAGEKTESLRRATLRQLSKTSGKLLYKIGEIVIDKESGQRGTISDYDPETGKYLVNLSPFEPTFMEESRIIRAIRQPTYKKADPDRIREAAASVNSIKRNATGSIKVSQALAGAILAQVEKAIGKLAFPTTPQLRYDGLQNVKFQGTEVTSAIGAVTATVATPLGADVHMEIPVPVKAGQVGAPTIFRYGSRVYPLGQDAVNKLFAQYQLVREIPRRPFSPPNEFVPDTVRMPDYNRHPFQRTDRPPLPTPEEGFGTGFSFR